MMLSPFFALRKPESGTRARTGTKIPPHPTPSRAPRVGSPFINYSGGAGIGSATSVRHSVALTFVRFAVFCIYIIHTHRVENRIREGTCECKHIVSECAYKLSHAPI